jgi:colanic acid biosynthesis glycosyl transferase WcaI
MTRRHHLDAPSVLIVNQYFPPDTSATAAIFADLAELCAGQGVDTSVLCGRPSYRPRERFGWKLFAVGDGRVRVERVGSAAWPMTSLTRRLANYLSFLALAGVRAALRPRADVVMCGSDPPLTVLVALVAARGRPTIYFLQDLHPETAISADWMPAGRLASLWDAMHRIALSRCSRVVCLGDEMRRRVITKGVRPDRILVVANGAPPPKENYDRAITRRIRRETQFAIVHAGNIGVAGAWETLVQAQELLREEAEFICVGDGAYAEKIESRGIRVEPFESDIAAVMAAGDLQLVTQRPETEGLLVPSKLYSALVHGRPILAVVPSGSEVAATVRASECGVIADPTNPRDVAEKVRALLRQPAQLAEMSRRAQRAGAGYRRPDVLAPIVREARELTDRSARR